MKKKEKPKPVKTKKEKFNAMEHWKGMPEFTMTSAAPVKQLIINFESMEDVHKFAKLVGQHITAKTRSIYFPEVLPENALDKRYSDKRKK